MAKWLNSEVSPVNRQMRAVLCALEQDPLTVSAIAKKARIPEDDAANAVQQLVAHNLAIPEDGGYELSGPLSWFGSFEAAVKHHARKRFIVCVPGDADSHLYVDDVRVKGTHKIGDPENETASVLACGRTASEVHPAADGPTCDACRNVLL
jgi:hypothetical protein